MRARAGHAAVGTRIVLSCVTMHLPQLRNRARARRRGAALGRFLLSCEEWGGAGQGRGLHYAAGSSASVAPTRAIAPERADS
jgi:hypothetical protein